MSQVNSKGLSNPAFKNRPQSSNYAGYRRKGLAGANAPNSANRIWKYNNGQVTAKQNLTTLSNTGGYGVQYVGHIGTAPATGLNRTNSTSKVFGTSPGRHFMT